MFCIYKHLLFTLGIVISNRIKKENRRVFLLTLTIDVAAAQISERS